MSLYAIAFAPHIPQPLLWTLIACAAILSGYALFMRAHGAWARLLALVVLILALAGPIAVRQTREPLNDVAVIVLDRSQSMQLGSRQPDAERAAQDLKAKLEHEPHLEVRVVPVNGGRPGDDTGTEAFAALDAALADVAPSRIAGAILVTDGEVHDVPPSARLKAPLNALIVGRKGEADRKLSIVDASRYAIVGNRAKIVLRVDDLGGKIEGSARINLRIDGADAGGRDVPLGRPTPVEVPIGHEGESVVEIEAEPGPAELSLQNNRAVVTVSGVRDRLRVLLISGEPNAGERVWRALLKGDPSVDLVHFTILRPPEKQDDTPLDQLSLIVFPTHELFAEKLYGFDLVVFDRYSEHGILPLGYFENIAAYVEQGGALLISAGPEFAGPTSIYRTPLAAVLPARPTGEIAARPFKPQLTAAGFAHPVTHELPGANTASAPPSWGRWFRRIGAETMAGETVMSGDGKPLLVLDRVGKGRVAELLSDQGWLWSRGYEGGGPEAELLRRTAHWLMKEPQLEEESLAARIAGGDIEIERHSMTKTPPTVTLTDPSGKTVPLTLESAAPGLWHGRARAEALGLYRVTDGKLSAVAAAGPLNPKEVSDMRATADLLAPAAEATGGAVRWYADGIPDIRRTAPGARGSGRDFALTENGATRVASVAQTPLLPPWLALLLLVGTLFLAWREEGM
jgi:hypothetical protein